MSSSRQTSPLRHISIVVTRPQPQNQLMCAKLLSLGARPIALPCMEIIPRRARLNLPARLDMVIFISPNAVEFGWQTFAALDERLTKGCTVAAIGAGTAQALHKQGIASVLVPAQSADSEGFLKLPETRAKRLKSALLIKGAGGRPLLQAALSQRGVKVCTAQVYRRILPRSAGTEALTRALDGKIDLILFTSNEIAQNFLALAPAHLRTPLLNCQTIVGHRRIAEKVTSLGFKNLPIIAASPTDPDMLLAITQWADKNGDSS